MKLFASLLLLATFAVVTPGHGQSATDSAVDSMSPIKRPTPKPTASPAAGTAAAPGPKKPLEASLAKDKEGKSPATTFAASEPKIYLVWKDDTAAKGDKLRVVWIAEDVTGVSTKNKKVSEGSQTLPGPGVFGAFFYAPAGSGGFPTGKYRAELYEGAKLVKSLKFTVTK